MAVRPDYRLQTLLEMRQRKKDEAEQQLGKSLKALHVEQQKLKQLEEELERMIARREAKRREYAEKAMRGEMSAQAVVSSEVYIDRLKEQEEAQKNSIEGQKGVVKQKEDEVQAARQALVQATQELKALEKHKEKWQEQVKKEIQAREEEVQDEVAQTIFLTRE